MSTENQKPEHRVLRIRIENRGASWRLVIIGFLKDQRVGCLFETQGAPTLDEALEELSDWRKGVIIV